MKELAIGLLSIPVFLLPAAAGAQEIVVDQPYVEPYEGMWIPVNELGSGLVIDQEDDTLVVTVFTYREDGSPVWYLAAGPIENGVFEQPAHEYRNGSCLACEWQPAEAGDSVSIRLEIIAHTLAWMSWDGGPPQAMRALPFDVPFYSSFFATSEHFSGPGMYNMSGRWLFISELKPESMLQTPLFEGFGYLEPGGAVWDVWEDSEWQGFGLYCRDPNVYPQSEVPHCVYGQKRLDNVERVDYPISVFWGDTAPDFLIGYEDPLKVGADGDIRGDRLVQGFRLTGPAVRQGSSGWQAESAPPAKYIDKGMWMFPGEPGSGLMLDWQNETLVYTIFAYDEQGNPLWYQGSGRFQGGTVEGNAFPFSGGSCLGCEYAATHEAGEPIGVRFVFTSKTIGWLEIEGGEPRAIRAPAFDSPGYREFNASGEFGAPSLYDLRGEWVFVSTEGLNRFFRRVTFTEPVQLRGGRTLTWRNADGTVAFRCDEQAKFDTPQCRLIDFSGEGADRLLSAHWADVGEDQIIAYEESPLAGENGVTRGERLIFGFRLSGPGSDGDADSR